MINYFPSPALPYLIVIVTSAAAAAAATDKTTVATEMEAPFMSSSPSCVVGYGNCFGLPKGGGGGGAMYNNLLRYICLRAFSRRIRLTSSASGTAY